MSSLFTTLGNNKVAHQSTRTLTENEYRALCTMAVGSSRLYRYWGHGMWCLIALAGWGLYNSVTQEIGLWLDLLCFSVAGSAWLIGRWCYKEARGALSIGRDLPVFEHCGTYTCHLSESSSVHTSLDELDLTLPPNVTGFGFGDAPNCTMEIADTPFGLVPLSVNNRAAVDTDVALGILDLTPLDGILAIPLALAAMIGLVMLFVDAGSNSTRGTWLLALLSLVGMILANRHNRKIHNRIEDHYATTSLEE